jgi:trehalose 6-phosphate phosphatase
VSLETAIRSLAEADSLLVMTDYDGTLTPIVTDPDSAHIDGATASVLAELAELPDTLVAVVSGRRLADLVGFLDVRGLVLIGGHGAETGEPLIIDQDQRMSLDKVVDELEEIARLEEGAFVEVKQTSAALHVRQVANGGMRLVALALEGPGRRPGARVIIGSEVVEISVSDVDKGTAVRGLRARHPGSVACFIGDDVTDEDAFAALGPRDIGIKVGEGHTIAALRLAGQGEVRPFLEEVVALRRGRPNA